MLCSIWRDAQVEQQQYRYYKPATRGLDQEGLLEDLSKGKPNDVVLLHACAHNPTGAPHLRPECPAKCLFGLVHACARNTRCVMHGVR